MRSGVPGPAREVNQPERPANFTGLWIHCLPDGSRTEQEYVGGVANGAYRSILANGVIHREGFKKNGMWHGDLIVHNSQGELLDKSLFVEGTGIYRIFNSEGQMTDEMPLVRGKLHGAARSWRLGKLVTTRFFEHGMCVAAICEAKHADVVNRTDQ